MGAGRPVIRFYEDEFPLTALYHLETILSQALAKTVWLKSGGNLVIEPTEALTVIDVNTAKSVSKKTSEETYLKTNLEAAEAIAVQLRLRNLSGIIIVDFIDMKEEESRKALLGGDAAGGCCRSRKDSPRGHDAVRPCGAHEKEDPAAAA